MSKLEKNFLLETRYEKDKKMMMPLLVISIIILPYLIIYFAVIQSWKKYYKEIRKMRDEEREIELLKIIQTKKWKNQKYLYAIYALADLGNKQIKEILVEKIIKHDGLVNPYSYDAQNKLAYGVALAYIVQKEQEEKWGK